MSISPKNDLTCGWIQTLPFRKENSPLSGKKRAKWVVIGAGYSGLATALTLAEHLPDDEIILIEANKAGEGASSRNSGYLVDSTLNDGHLSDSGLTAYKSKYNLNKKAIDTVQSFTEKYNIKCGWNECGKYHASANLKTKTKLRNFNLLLNDLGIKNDFIEADELRSNLGTDFYKMAVKTQGGIMLQPATLARGLISALPSNVTLYENTAVIDINKGTASPHKITCKTGELLADNLIITVNGFMPSLGIKQNRVFPLLLTASLTRQLSKQEQEKMNNCAEWGVLSANAMGATVRYTQDKRIMIRNTVEVSSSLTLSSKELSKRKQIHLFGLKKRFSFLPDNIFEYSWSGITCISANNANIFEKIAKNCWLIGCYNGGGIGLSVLFGQQIALKAMSEPLTESQQAVFQQIKQRPKPSWLPPQPFLNIGISVKLAKDRLGAKSDN